MSYGWFIGYAHYYDVMEYWKPRCYFRFVCKNKNIIANAIYDRSQIEYILHMLQLVFNDIIAKDRCILTDTSALHPTKQTYRTLFFSRESDFFTPKYTRGSQENCVFRDRGN